MLRKLLPLPDGTLVAYPAQGWVTVRQEAFVGHGLIAEIRRRMNYALQPMTKEEFSRLVTADQPDAPEYFTFDAILNTRERGTLDSNLERVLKPVELDEVILLGDAGEQLLDVRDAAEFAKGHLAGSINIGLGERARLGGLLDLVRPIVIIAEPGREQEAALRLGRIGFDHVRGYLDGGMAALAARPDLVWPTERVSAAMVKEELGGPALHRWCWISDPGEWKRGIFRGAWCSAGHTQTDSEFPHGQRIAVHCAGGYRSSIAASILHQHGITNLIEMAGGLAAWEAAKLPVVA